MIFLGLFVTNNFIVDRRLSSMLSQKSTTGYDLPRPTFERHKIWVAGIEETSSNIYNVDLQDYVL